ncbi:MAG: endolytic transglycosylase MltG [Putridiphycobacter sp.]
MAKKRKKKLKWFKISLIVILLIGIGLAGIGGNYYYKNFKVANVDFKGTDTTIFIPLGSTQESVLKQLEDMKILKDFESFKWLADQKNYKNNNVVPGQYKIQNGWSNNQLINHLRAGNGRLDAKVRFASVRTLKDLSNAMAKEILLSPDEIHDWLTNKDSIQKYGFNQQTIISMFIPNTYYVDFDITVGDLMKRMAKEYKTFWNEDRKAKAIAIGLSQSDVVTLASIVYSETNSDKDMPTIAGVYMNRIEKGWPLQADPTLIFALNDFTIKRVLNKHKKIDSPYNTYKYKGLPPGPINIPPIKYIDAVLNYEKHDYMYFVAKEDFSGDSYFAKNLAQHMIYARRYQKALNDRKIYN